MDFYLTSKCVKVVTTFFSKTIQGNHQFSCSYGLFKIFHFLGLWKVYFTTLATHILHILFIFIILNMNYFLIQNLKYIGLMHYKIKVPLYELYMVLITKFVVKLQKSLIRWIFIILMCFFFISEFWFHKHYKCESFF